MSALALGIATGLVALRCQLIADDPYVLGSVSRVIPATRPAFVRALNKTRRAIGCPVDDDVVEPSALFSGGQCVGKPYRYQYRVIQADGTVGPYTVVQCSAGRFGPIGLRRAQNGAIVSWYLRSSNSAGVSQEALIATSNSQIVVELQIISTCNGTADDCGDSDPDYPPPINKPTNIDITFEGDDGDINVNIPIIFTPITVNLDGSLRIPITFDLGGFEFSGDVNLPDFNVTVNPPGLPPGSGEDYAPVGDDEPGETVPPAPPGKKIIGVVVNSQITQPGRVGSVNFVNAPSIIIPRAASVKFAYSLGAATFWSSDIDVKTLRAFVPCPFSQGADAVVVTPYIGLETTFVPIKGFALATVQDLRAGP